MFREWYKDMIRCSVGCQEIKGDLSKDVGESREKDSWIRAGRPRIAMIGVCREGKRKGIPGRGSSVSKTRGLD